MGFWKKLLNFFGLAKTNVSLLVIGLDNSGKTSIINKLKAKKMIESTPTIGFNIETFTKKNFRFEVIDMSGQSQYRLLWESYYSKANGIVFVLDSSDSIRFQIAKYELDQLLVHNDIKSRTSVPILFFANKMDLEYSVKAWELEAELDLSSISNRAWSIHSSNALTGEGLEEGLSWIMSKLDKE